MPQEKTATEKQPFTQEQIRKYNGMGVEVIRHGASAHHTGFVYDGIFYTLEDDSMGYDDYCPHTIGPKEIHLIRGLEGELTPNQEKIVQAILEGKDSVALEINIKL